MKLKIKIIEIKKRKKNSVKKKKSLINPNQILNHEVYLSKSN